MTPWRYIDENIAILITVCNEFEGHKYVTIPVGNDLQLPTKATWATNRLPSYTEVDFKVLYVHNGNASHKLYYATTCLQSESRLFETRDTQTGKFKPSAGNFHMKLYNGSHCGLDNHTTMLMKAVHRKYFCHMGMLEQRHGPYIPNGGWCMYPPSNAGVFVYERTAYGVRVCLVQERSGKWNIPSGKIDGKETGTKAAIRELREETSGVIRVDSNKRHDFIQVGSFHLVFVEVTNDYWLHATNEFQQLRKIGRLGQRETIDMKWVFVSELSQMALNHRLRGCFASLLGKHNIVHKIHAL